MSADSSRGERAVTLPGPSTTLGAMAKSLTVILLLALVGAVGYLGYLVHGLSVQLAARDETIAAIYGEVTRIRIEQSTGVQGPAGLLQKLKTYAPMVTSSSVTQPDYQAAVKEMNAVLRAMKTVGKDCWQPVQDRIGALDAAKDADELRWLVEASIAVDRAKGLELAHEVVLGHKLPSPRLRWLCADMLLREDRQLAQVTLRQVLLTESARGVNMDRAAAYGAVIPDKSAFATTGFSNFVTKYVQSEDPQTDDTLLMVIGRTEHDQITVQECVKALGAHKCKAAVEPIEQLFQNPPNYQDNPLFQKHCLDALEAILGKDARPFFERMLPLATSDTVRNHLEHLLGQ